jgi:protein-disulfide isomerase
MGSSLTLNGWSRGRVLSLLAGAGMMAGAALAGALFFDVRYPATRAAAGWCGEAAFLRCDSALLSAVGAPAGVPLGWYGLLLGSLVVLGALFPSRGMERTNRMLAVVNGALVVLLFGYSVLALKSLCLLCTGYGAASLLNAALFLLWRDQTERLAAFVPAPMHLAVAGVVVVAGGWSVSRYDAAVGAVELGAATRAAVTHFYSLPQVPWPSQISPYWTVRSTAEFEAAPIRIVQYSDLLCVDCQVLYAQLKQLESEFPGQLNIAYQFFPLEAKCNDVVDKDKHPGSCDLAYMAAFDTARFVAIHDDVYDHMQRAKEDPDWRADLARRHGVEAALADSALHERVHRLIRTGTEYEKTSDRFAYGIRSTPTLIINNRMIIGTMPLEQLRAIFQALVEEHATGGATFIEGWIDSGCAIDPAGGPPIPCGTTP